MATWKADPFAYRRRPTRVVRVGDVPIGGRYPIRVQSMTTPATTDTAATVEQICRLAEAGCEIVRVTVPTSADAENLPNIRRELKRRRVSIPLIADIHFTPAAALKAVEHVDKVRINPGNFADKKKFAVREYTDVQYAAEIERIERAVLPLVKRCKELGRPMRIGTNHGSLSDRIMNRYGDTPEGMVESALEFVRICEAQGLRDLILSMKASNPVVVLQAYRRLAEKMNEEEMDYPVHLGVTEAGDGEDGRIKSAIGIGALLDEGIGDTVRVSLTEDPVEEIPVAQALVEPYNARLEEQEESPIQISTPPSEARDPYSYARRTSREVRLGPRSVGGTSQVLVEVPLHTRLTDAEGIRRELDDQVGPRVPQDTRAELLSVRLESWDELGALTDLRRLLELVALGVALSVRIDELWTTVADEDALSRLASAAHRLHLRVGAPLEDSRRSLLQRLRKAASRGGAALLVEAGPAGGSVEEAVDEGVRAVKLARDGGDAQLLVTLDPTIGASPMLAMRMLAARLAAEGLDTPLVLLDRPLERNATPLLATSSALGGLLCDGIGDAIHIEAASASESRRLAYNILQAARVRMTRTDFISCPSCGRTLFDLEDTTARIKARTAHLKNVKIAIMGCVVNGPGEMADADFGYVGWGENKIALFVGKEMVEKDIPTEQADERLVELIKRHGMWADPPAGAY